MSCDDGEHLFEARILLRGNAVVYKHAYEERFFRRQSTPKLLYCIFSHKTISTVQMLCDKETKEKRCAPSNSSASNTSTRVTNTLSLHYRALTEIKGTEKGE
jgi:hypothetical protein